jgi:flagellar biosynthesis GTPase FlhF
LARHKVLTGVGAVVLLLVVIGALNGGNKDREAPVVAAEATQEADEEKSAEEIAAEEEAEAERQAEEEAEAAAEAEEERLAEEQRLAEEAAAAEAAAAEAVRIGTVAQQNAYRSAVSYLNYTAFSRSGLIGQLEYEEYSTGDAEFAIARLEAEGGVDWNAQAAQKAADYLAYSSFSRSGLISQLLYEGFTAEQAEYGVSTTGL